MRTNLTFASCLAFALASLSCSPAGARVLRPPHDFVFPSRHAGLTRAALHPAYTPGSYVGTSNEATADPPVARPNETPCTAMLFTAAPFDDYSQHTFTYTPPANCPGPYNRIVFDANFNVSAGIQFDRTASIEIANVPIYFGTTAEPSETLSPSWHVERDITDDAALLLKPREIEAQIYNIVNSTYTGKITGTAFIQFYPASAAAPAAGVPDLVLPFVAGGPQALSSSTSTLSASYALPTNVDRLFFDVYAQSQQTDEQYFNCAPNDVASELFACGNGPFRETEVSVDGVPAGVAPIYPWIYTGGLDPFLWFPIPGVQTLDFQPYRVDLTPFAGQFADGQKHTITLSVDNADNYFQAFATLYGFLDSGVKAVHGGIISNNLVAPPVPAVTENLGGSSPAIDGTIAVQNLRNYTIAGYVVGSKGRVTTVVNALLNFSNVQNYSNESDFTGTLAVTQATQAATRTLTVGASGFNEQDTFVSFPLTESLAVALDDTGTGTQVTSIKQQFVDAVSDFGSSGNFVGSYDSNTVTTGDTLNILDDAYITGNSNQSSGQTYTELNSTGYCYRQTIAAAANVLTSASSPSCSAAEAKAFVRKMRMR